MNENLKYVVIPWELAVSIDETLDMDLRMASIYDGDDIDGSGSDYGGDAAGIQEDRKALRKAMAKAIEDELTPDFFNQNGVVWHPYPEKKPNDIGRYLITMRSEGGCLDVIEDYYDSLYDEWTSSECYGWDIIAWAEKPEPYKEDEK